MKLAPAATSASAEPAAGRSSAAEPLLVLDLLLDFEDLVQLLSAQLERGSGLDAFLLAAGLNQVLEDHLHRDVAALARVARLLPGVASVVRAARAAALALRSNLPGERRLIAWQNELQRGVEALAGDGGDAAVAAALERMPTVPRRLRGAIMRLPTSFRSLDQRPADLESMVNDFASSHPDRGRPILVIGLRTSGSYLAPLYRRFLLAAGYREVEAMTLRPSDGFLPHEVRRIRRMAGDRALVLLADDPPKSGSSLARAAQAVERSGVPRGSIKLLLPRLESDGGVPPALEPYEAIVLPWQRWDVRRLLSPAALADALDELLRDEGTNVEAVEVLDAGPRSDLTAGSPVRRHVRAVFRATVRDAAGIVSVHEVYVKGVGLGYFGGHSLVVAEQLADFLPRLYGVRDGLLFREWLPEADRFAPGRRAYLPGVVGEYAAVRGKRLAVAEDRSLRTAGLNPVWQRIADMLGRSFGRQRLIFRPVLHATARRLVFVKRPAVIDGSMAHAQWFDAGDRVVKVDYDERAFSNQDTVIDQLYSYDPVYDLAMASADYELETDSEQPDSGFTPELIQSYASSSGRTVDAERWFLYQRLHLASQQGFVESLRMEVEAGAISGRGLEALTIAAVRDSAGRTSRALARVDQRYLAETLWPERAVAELGPLCAIDIDGVLETGRRGYSSANASGVLALRALALHGFAPVLATGRSAGEVIDRCRAFNLLGGVAEYGAVVYDHRAGRLVELLEPAEVESLGRLRHALLTTPNVHVDPAYRRVVRAALVDGDKLRPLQAELVRNLLADLGLDPAVRAVHGLAQTDLAVARVDKRSGARALARLLRSDRAASPVLAFAIGDSASDLSLLAEARSAYAPSNATAAVKASGARVMPGDHQAGLTQAVADLVGHAPGGCRICRSPELDPEAEVLLTAMSAADAGRWSKLVAGLRIAMALAKR